MVKSGDGEIYERFEKRLSTKLTDRNPQNKLVSFNIVDFESRQNVLAMTHFDTIISVGTEAGIAVSKYHIDKPILMAMLPRDGYTRLIASGEIVCEIKNCRALFLDQPIKRQLQFLKLALPSAKRVTILSSQSSLESASQITLAAGKFSLSINTIKVTDVDSVLDSLKQDLTNTDVLMAIPDPVVYNRNTARAILLSAFYRHIPIYAYSRSFVRAGATFGIFSTPEDIANHVADILLTVGTRPATNQIIYPKYYTIEINRRAADALGITIENRELLAQRLKAYENE